MSLVHEVGVTLDLVLGQDVSVLRVLFFLFVDPDLGEQVVVQDVDGLDEGDGDIVSPGVVESLLALPLLLRLGHLQQVLFPGSRDLDLAFLGQVLALEVLQGVELEVETVFATGDHGLEFQLLVVGGVHLVIYPFEEEVGVGRGPLDII